MKLTTQWLTAALGLITAAEAGFDSPQAALQAVMSNSQTTGKQQPNILFIITDDQDLELNSTSYTPLTLKHLRDKGTTFQNHFVTTALCCPSRVSLWTGRQAHNTNVTDVKPPYGRCQPRYHASV